MTGRSTTSSSVRYVPYAELEAVWPVASAALERGLEYHPGCSLADLWDALVAEHAQLWSVDDRAWCVVQRLTYQRRTVLLVYGLAGSEIQGWRRALSDALAQYAREIGADTVRCFTHTRLAVVLGHAGWRHQAHVMELDVDG